MNEITGPGRIISPEGEISSGRIDALLALGMGPVHPQLRGNPNQEGVRRPIAHFERMRTISIAAKELAVNNMVEADGFVILSGKATPKPEDVQSAYQERMSADESDLMSLSPVDFKSQDQLGKPKSAQEVERIKQTTEANLMQWLVENTSAKKGPKERKKLSQKLLEEPLAPNSIQNFVHAINLLDEKTGKVWEGNIGVLTSNFGHISRARELLQAFGFDHVTALSAEQVLRHYGYNQEYLDRYEGLNADEKTLQNQERWRRGVREMPASVFPEVVHFKNDQRLVQVIYSLRNWYKQHGVRLDEFGFADLDSMTPDQIRNTLQTIQRELAPEAWGQAADTAVWKLEIQKENELTEQWLNNARITSTTL